MAPSASGARCWRCNGLVGPETEWVLAAQGYPGMGPGKLRPAGDGLFGIDHSLAEVWFDLHATDRLRLQWGLGSVGMGPGTRNLLWNADMAPAPYLLIDVDLGKGWHYRWLQSRQRSTERLPADGVREGRYAPLGLGVRSLGKSFSMGESQLNVNWIVAQWTDALHRGNDRSALADWGLALAPWSLPAPETPPGPMFWRDTTGWMFNGADAIHLVRSGPILPLARRTL